MTSPVAEQPLQRNHNAEITSSSDNDYATADEYDEEEPLDEHSQPYPVEAHDSEGQNQIFGQDNWTHVAANKHLPKVKSTIDCIFPGYTTPIKCKILSKAGKSTTNNWHYMNIKEGGEDCGKCCSFQNAKWRAVDDNEITNESTPNEILFGQCSSVFDI